MLIPHHRLYTDATCRQKKEEKLARIKARREAAAQAAKAAENTLDLSVDTLRRRWSETALLLKAGWIARGATDDDIARTKAAVRAGLLFTERLDSTASRRPSRISAPTSTTVPPTARRGVRTPTRTDPRAPPATHRLPAAVSTAATLVGGCCRPTRRQESCRKQTRLACRR